ncbi:hypothetical protein HPB51_006227 [Rhipicephalus microplus]|uniref:Uncharacterized protein n=1 Tax=Rhipicephalus microplus TaxID=6941 RepID=A0A9J6DL20_RHIMP|nr:hypothetical protein HPB51_006227 [Rhipicephalus microplus]
MSAYNQCTAVSEEARQQEWLEVSSGISLALQGEEELPDDVVPYDSTLDNTENEQKLDALGRIQAALKARETAKAVALLRAGQELWPGQSMFGSQEEETEFQALKEIFFANFAGFVDIVPPCSSSVADLFGSSYNLEFSFVVKDCRRDPLMVPDQTKLTNGVNWLHPTRKKALSNGCCDAVDQFKQST